MRIQQWGFRSARMFTASPRAFGYRPLRNPTYSNPMPQMDVLTLDTPPPPLSHSPSSKPEASLPKIGSAILHRTPWTPPTAVRASGINIELEDGSQVIDAVGGAAVSCLGMGIRESWTQLPVKWGISLVSLFSFSYCLDVTRGRDVPAANRSRVFQWKGGTPPW
jgi:hypothetical protein